MSLARVRQTALLLTILFIMSSCISPFDETVTVYPTRETVSGKQITSRRIAFKASFETQKVVYWYPGWRETPERLINCTVFDEDNWAGEYIDHSGKVEMEGGMIVGSAPGISYVSSVHWWYLHIKEKYFVKTKETHRNAPSGRRPMASRRLMNSPPGDSFPRRKLV
ncbi:MAG: hypothetical protein ACWGPR_11315 [Candidatus Deferrimicrobiaceae bacterium]